MSDLNLLVPLAPSLRAAFERVGFNTDQLFDVLGPQGLAALGRGEPVPVRRAVAGMGDLGVLVRLFLLTDELPEGEAALALAPVSVDDAVAAGLLERGEGTLRAALDLRPIDFGAGSRWVLSDLDGALRPDGTRSDRADHVLGVGQASLSLLRATPSTPVRTLLDLGAGSGVQALRAVEYAEHVTGTDVLPRALELARATFALNGIDGVELLEGSWFEPVAGRKFERIVANPPFVVGDPAVRQVYRDSGLDLDGASELVVRALPDHLEMGGTAAMLAAWVHADGQDWRTRVASWLPPHGVDAWVVQRDVADPALYVGTWLRDGGLDPREPAGAARADQWLSHLEESGVDAIGFGFVFLRRTNLPSDVLCEDLTHGFDDPLGDEALSYFERVAWLRENDVLTARLRVNPSVALERVSVPDEDEGWRQAAVRLHRGDGPRWQHDIDDSLARLLAGINPDGLPVEDLLALLAFAESVSEDDLELTARPALVDLVRHGLILPA